MLRTLTARARPNAQQALRVMQAHSQSAREAQQALAAMSALPTQSVIVYSGPKGTGKTRTG